MVVPSTDTSDLILYSIKPGIYISNYYPIIPKLEYFKFLGNIDYLFYQSVRENKLANTLLGQ